MITLDDSARAPVNVETRTSADARARARRESPSKNLRTVNGKEINDQSCDDFRIGLRSLYKRSLLISPSGKAGISPGKIGKLPGPLLRDSRARVYPLAFRRYVETRAKKARESSNRI